MTAPSARAGNPRFAALRVADYRSDFALSLLSMTADNIEHVISYWVIFQSLHVDGADARADAGAARRPRQRGRPVQRGG
ncbi:MAG TPA: hypothetical protein VML54_12105, partial [Candidatus Limnocylindrales bacterium]|nr:hypothetical protein [Candidatus Limnocylindrales bacterium]